LFYVLQILDRDYPHLEIYVAARHVKQTKAFLNRYQLKRVHLVKHLSRKYLSVLASAAYLLNDTSFYHFFIKKPGQQYVNFWHGTPLKTLGQDMENLTDAANVQRNFYMVDQLIVNNAFLAKVLADSHGLNGIYQGKLVIGPSPRNAILLDLEKRAEVRAQLGLCSKKVCFYLPTWRGNVNCIHNETDKIMADLHYLSQHFSEEMILYVKLHPFSQEIELEAFDQVLIMPADYELYEFLTAVDVLITDYSSIMYDFLLTNRKIILYTYDQENYFKTRGVYDDISRYPFVKVEHVHELLMALQDHETAFDYKTMIDAFCPIDVVNGAQLICDYIFKNERHALIQESTLSSEKETVFILGGGFWDNGVTTALLNTFDNISLTDRHYVVLLGQKQLEKKYEFRIRNLSNDIIFYPFPEQLTAGVIDRFLYMAYLKFECFNGHFIRRRIGAMVSRDYHRIFGNLKVDHVIHFTGFGNRYGTLIQYMPDHVHTVMYVHTDMMAEYEAKKNFSKKIIFSAYRQVNKVAVVHENLKLGLLQNFPWLQNQLYVMTNFLGEARVREWAKVDWLATLTDVEMEHGDKDNLIAALADEQVTVFMTIGRFDYQKGHDRLIKAFTTLYETNQQIRLVMVAPHGPLRQQTLDLIKNSAAHSSIYVLGRMANPYALLAKCDCFVLSSHYEGLGLVVYEALAVGTVVVTVALKEVIGHLQNNEAIIVPNSIQGIQEGMAIYLSGYQVNAFDFSMPKEQSKSEFERLLDQNVAKGKIGDVK